MQALSFTLSGKTACFRKPDVNAYAYFTYNNIHKPALCGLLGAIIGLRGYTQLHEKKEHIRQQMKKIKGKEKKALKEHLQRLDTELPEFYDKLKNLKISITPLSCNGYFSKKIHTFNNSVGYANGMVSGTSDKALRERRNSSNLMVREQWLENPAWQIMILDDGSEEFQTISDYLLHGKAVFIPYLGKNDHPATIRSVESLQLETAVKKMPISSLFNEKQFELSKMPPRNGRSYLFKEFSPIRLHAQYQFYEYISLVLTNHKIQDGDYSNVYSYNGNNYAFF